MFMSNSEIDKITWQLVRSFFGFTNDLQWWLMYKDKLNKEITRIIKGNSSIKLSNVMQQNFDALDEDMKNIKIKLKVGNQNNGKNNVKGNDSIVPKCKNIHFPIVNWVILNLPTDCFGETINYPKISAQKSPEGPIQAVIKKYN